MENKGIETVIVTDPKNMHYYSGFYKGEGYAVISRSKHFIVTDSRYTEYAESVCKGFEVADISEHKPSDFVSENALVGFEDKSISYDKYVNLAKQIDNLTPVGDMLIAPREIKDDDEIKSIRKAVTIADDAFSHICSYITKGMTEKEVAAEIDCYMKKHGAEDSSFSTIAAAGERGSLPHAIPSERTLKTGDLVVMDFGCIVDGYCSDMTRTVAVGDISSECEKIYNTVLEAQLSALKSIKAGALACDVDNVARNIIDSLYPKRFGHALGHSVGLDIHEAPNLSPKNSCPLKTNNVVTVEPGIYIPGLCGVRIEDLVVVGDDGCDILTKSPKQIIAVG
ncbi:MAG: aminopeptidase P family protein [Clostridia bacterium]|nr:aminopeptidase P family protein [Clostridia bacterium]